MRLITRPLVRILLIALVLVGWCLDFLHRNIVRIFMLLVLLTMLPHFVLNDPQAAKAILRKVSEVIPGEIKASRIVWKPLSNALVVFDVEITRPGGVPVISAGRVDTELRLGRLIGGVLSGLVFEARPVPLFFDKARVRDAVVNLEFSADGPRLIEAFVDPEEEVLDLEEEAEPGPPPDLRIRGIEITSARVNLDFWHSFGIRVRGASLSGEFYLKSGEPVVDVRNIFVRKVRFKGLPELPANLAFLAKDRENVQIASYFLKNADMEIGDTVVDLGLADLHARGSIMASGKEVLFSAILDLEAKSPELLHKVSDGLLLGMPHVRANLSGSPEALNVELGVTSPWLDAFGLMLHEVQILVKWDSLEPTYLQVPWAEAVSELGSVRISGFNADLTEAPDLRGRICFEELDLKAVLDRVGLEWPEDRSVPVAPELSGCTAASLAGDGRLRVSGEIYGFDREGQGRLPYADLWYLQGDVQVEGSQVTSKGLTLVAGSDSAELAGEVDLASGKFNAFGWAELDGPQELLALFSPETVRLRRLSLPAIVVQGGPAGISLDAGVYLDSPGFMGLNLNELSTAVQLSEGELWLQNLCVNDAALSTCLDVRLAGLLDGLKPGGGPWPLHVRSLTPVEAVPALLPWSLPLSVSRLALSGLSLRADVLPGFPFLGGQLELGVAGGMGDVRFNDLRVSGLEFSTRVQCPCGLNGSCALTLEAEADGLAAGGVELESASLAAELSEVSLFVPWYSLAASGLFLDLSARGFGYGQWKVHGLRAALTLPERQNGSLSIVLQPSADTSIAATGTLRRPALSGDALITFNGLGSGLLPAELAASKGIELLSGALLEGRVALSWPGLDGLQDGKTSRFIGGLAVNGELVAKNLAAVPQPLDYLKLRFAFSRSVLELQDFVTELWGQKGAVRGSAKLDFEQQLLSGKLDTDFIAVEDLALLAGKNPGFRVMASVTGDFAGPFAAPAFRGVLKVRDLGVAGIALGSADLLFEGSTAEAVTFRSKGFLAGTVLNELSVRFRENRPESVHVNLDVNRLDPARFLSSPLPVTLSLTGHLEADATLPGEAPPEVSYVFTVPASGLLASYSVQEGELSVHNPYPVTFTGNQEKVATECLLLETELGLLSLAGKVHFKRGYDLALSADLVADNHWLLNPYLASHRLSLRVGSRKSCTLTTKSMKLRGPLDDLQIEGPITIRPSTLLPRHFSGDLRIAGGVLWVKGRAMAGDLDLELRPDQSLKGTLDDGAMSLTGSARIEQFVPTSLKLALDGSNLEFKTPNQFRLMVNPSLKLDVRYPLDPKLADGGISGDVNITEGEYYRNFDKLLGSFGNAFAVRSQERYSKSVFEVLPFLDKLRLNLGLHFTGLHLASRFPFGETDMEVSASLHMRGTMAAPELYDRLSIVPGGVITYKVVRRDFDVVSGYVDFTGDLARPSVDIRAQTYVKYVPSDTYYGTVTEDERRWGKDILIDIRVFGTYPELTFELGSENSEFDQADLQTLLLLGMTRADLENRMDATGMSISLLTDDVADALSGVLLSAFLDEVSLGFTQQGGIRAETVTKVGRAIELDTRVQQDDTYSEYSAGFRFMLTDEVFLEGRMKMRQEEDQTYRNYEGRIRYRIPLE